MMIRTFCFLAALAVVAVSAFGIESAPARATPVNLVTNGDFSTGDFTGWTIFSPEGGGYVSSGSANLIAGTGYGYLYQDITVTPNTKYRFAFTVATSALEPDRFTAWADMVNGPPLLDLVDIYQDDQDISIHWVPYVFYFVATANSTRIGFRYFSEPTTWGLDDVSVISLGTVPIPNPGILLITALGVLTACAHWSRSGRVRESAQPCRG